MFTVTIVLPGGERVAQTTWIPYIAGDAVGAIDKRGNYFPILRAVEVYTNGLAQTVRTER